MLGLGCSSSAMTLAGGKVLINFSFLSNLFHDVHSTLCHGFWPHPGWRWKWGRTVLTRFGILWWSGISPPQEVSAFLPEVILWGFQRFHGVCGSFSSQSLKTPSSTFMCLIEPQTLLCWGVLLISQPSRLGYKRAFSLEWPKSGSWEILTYSLCPYQLWQHRPLPHSPSGSSLYYTG